MDDPKNKIDQPGGTEEVGFKLNPDAIRRFSKLLRDGLMEAATVHEKAVQGNAILSAKTTLRLETLSEAGGPGLSGQVEGEGTIKLKISGTEEGREKS